MGVVTSNSVDFTRIVKLELIRRKAYEDFLTFFKAHPPKPQYIYGDHTIELIHELDKTTKMVESGQCRFLIFCLPFRQGKSDVSSRRWPGWHEIRNPDHEFMITSYGFDLAASMAYDVRECIRDVGPSYNIFLKKGKEAIGSFGFDSHSGKVHSAGLRGTITGKGADILLVDDYFKNREEAESDTISQKVWDSFESDLMTRMAPIHAVVIVANRWNTKDLVGRIINKNDEEHEDYDPDFPKFEIIKKPIYDEKKDKFLFEERFGRTWYIQRRAAIGSYAWNSQGMQDPVPKGGNRFDVRNLVFHNDIRDFPDIRYYRAWDPASSEKERNKESPDRTAGCKLGIIQDKSNPNLVHIWVKDIVYGRWEAPERNRKIKETALQDGSLVRQGVESVAGYKDAYTTVKEALNGMCFVQKIVVKGDKTVQASILEAPVEAGTVHIIRAGWNRILLDEMRVFPHGDHDDLFNSLWLAYRMALKGEMLSLKGLDRSVLGI